MVEKITLKKIKNSEELILDMMSTPNYILKLIIPYKTIFFNEKDNRPSDFLAEAAALQGFGCIWD